jgi:catechol 1,2-dioxygenase
MTNEELGYFTADNSAEVVVARMGDCPDARLKAIMASVVHHLHAVVKEVEPTLDEWTAAIEFLTKTGQMCDDRRQEYILLSDTLGVSMLVDAINHRKPSGATETTVLGPFHTPNAPAREMGDNICLDGQGEPGLISGRVVDGAGNPVEGASLDVWQANDAGFYDTQQPGIQPEMNLRGIFTTGADGRYWFRTVKPRYYKIPDDGPVGQMLGKLARHPFRPAHTHFIVAAPGYEPVTTHLFVRGDPYLDSDAVFGVKQSLIRDFDERNDPEEAAELGLPNPFWTLEADFTLVRAEET